MHFWLNQPVLKTCAEIIAKPLKIIFEKSLKEGKLPEWWKRANVTFIFKKGCRSDRKNFRPVSLTLIICKILESFVRDGIMEYGGKWSLIQIPTRFRSEKKLCHKLVRDARLFNQWMIKRELCWRNITWFIKSLRSCPS